jgi:hypothetical protein
MPITNVNNNKISLLQSSATLYNKEVWTKASRMLNAKYNIQLPFKEAGWLRSSH